MARKVPGIYSVKRARRSAGVQQPRKRARSRAQSNTPLRRTRTSASSPDTMTARLTCRPTMAFSCAFHSRSRSKYAPSAQSCFPSGDIRAAQCQRRYLQAHRHERDCRTTKANELRRSLATIRAGPATHSGRMSNHLAPASKAVCREKRKNPKHDTLGVLASHCLSFFGFYSGDVGVSGDGDAARPGLATHRWGTLSPASGPAQRHRLPRQPIRPSRSGAPRDWTARRLPSQRSSVPPLFSSEPCGSTIRERCRLRR